MSGFQNGERKCSPPRFGCSLATASPLQFSATQSILHSVHIFASNPRPVLRCRCMERYIVAFLSSSVPSRDTREWRMRGFKSLGFDLKTAHFWISESCTLHTATIFFYITLYSYNTNIVAVIIIMVIILL